jgi:hypothetical protein
VLQLRPHATQFAQICKEQHLNNAGTYMEAK